MPEPPRTGDAVIDLVRKSELADDDVLNAFLQRSGPIPPSPADTASRLVRAGVLTPFQARAILQGKHRGFLLGPYRILDQIGSGGMGQVYLAEHAHMRRRVALKVLPPRLAVDKAMVERFYREARAVAALDHPNIVRAHDVACDRGTHYLVLEYVSGQSLADRLVAAGGVLAAGEACGYAVQAAAGLQHAHDTGLAHRDVKPANLLVADDGVVKILDMGLARFFEDDGDRLTRSIDPGAVMGTADYVSPEQLLDTSAADHRTDIYALGATLYHLVTGRPPFEGTTTAKLIAHQMKAVPPAHEVRADVPEEVSEIIARMMAKDPADRYQSAAEVVAALLPHVSEVPSRRGMPSGKLPPIAAAAVSQTTANLQADIERARQVRRRKLRKKRIALAALAAVVVLGGAVIAVVALHDSKPVARSAPPPDPGENTKPGGAPAPPDVPEVFTLAYRLPYEKHSVEAALFTPGDKMLVTSGADKLIRVWNAADGRPVRKLEGHAQNVRALSLLPDGRRLLSASQDKTLKLWDLGTGECLRTYEGHATQVVGVAALPDGRRFLSSASDGTVWLWGVEAGEVLKKYAPAPLPVYGLAVTRDGRRAVAGTWDSRRNAAKADLSKLPPVRAWLFEVETGNKLRELPSDASISHVRTSPDGRFAVFGTGNGVTVWDLDTGSFRAFGGLTKRVTGATFARDGRHVLGTGYESAVTVWDVATGKPVMSEGGMAGQGYFVAASHNGKRVAVVGANGTANVWNLPAGMVSQPRDPNLPRPVASLTRPDGTPEDVIFTPDGTRVIGAANNSKHLMVWDAATGTELARMRLPDAVTGCRALAFLPNDRLASCFASDPVVRVWDLKTGEPVRELSAAGVKGFVSVAATADGRVLATATDKTVRMWATNGEAEVDRFDLKAEGRGIAVTPDGKRFVVGCADTTVRLWDTVARNEARRMTAGSVAWRVSLSPDTKWAAFGSGNLAAAWGLDSGEVRNFTGPAGVVDGVVFTRDGRFLLGGSVDRGLHAWEFASSRWLGRATEHTSALRSVALSPDGNRVATSSTDNTGVVWQLPEVVAK